MPHRLRLFSGEPDEARPDLPRLALEQHHRVERAACVRFGRRSGSKPYAAVPLGKRQVRVPTSRRRIRGSAERAAPPARP